MGLYSSRASALLYCTFFPHFNLGVGGLYSNGYRQNENSSIDEIVDFAKISALIYMRKPGI